MAVIDHDAGLSRAGANVRGPFGALLFFVRRYPLGAIGGLIMIAFLATALCADWITTYDPLSTNVRGPPSPRPARSTLWAPLYVDGAPPASIYGARISLAVGVGATVLGCLIGVTVGLLSGFFGGWFDLLAQR